MIAPPPQTRLDDTVDILHGVTVPDPYRWLERGDDPEVRAWVAGQNERTRAVLDAIPDRARWHRRLVELMGLPIVLGAQVRGGQVVLLERLGGAQQSRLVVRRLDAPDAEPVVLADPALGTDDAAAAVDWFETSPDGRLVAFGVSEGGTENSVLRIARSADGGLLDDEIPNCRACSVAWEPDGSGFHYTRYPEGDEYHRTVHHHVIGDDWRDDPVVWADHPTPQAWPTVVASPDGRFLLVEVMVGWGRTAAHLLDLVTGGWRTLVDDADAVSHFVFADDATLLGTTTLDAPCGRIVRVDLEGAASPADWETVVPERGAVLGVPQVVPGGWYVTATERGVDRVEWWSEDADQASVVAGLGMVSVGGIAADRTIGTTLALVTGFDRPGELVRLDGGAAARTWFPVTGGDRPPLSVDQVDYTSPDGTTIGLFLVHRDGVRPGPETPTILNGYGGFSLAITPAWSPTIAAWCEAGGLYAIAGLRGGAEHGEEWHEAGRRANKQNVFDDFHAAADWLVEQGCTTRERLGIFGRSNGGLLVGAALTQRPDLCRAVWCAVPLLDMVRFPDFLIARLWTDEYGDPDVPEEFGWLHAYSPYHRVVDGERYPSVLLTTAEGDTRVDPLHARKMAARLQHAAADQHDRPILLHQEGRAGHGVGKPVAKQADEHADALAFFSWQLGLEP
jgi:prolyl oligopeptidase